MPRGGLSNIRYEYRDWRVCVGRVGIRGEYDAQARKGEAWIYTRRFAGHGAKLAAEAEIRALIDAREDATRGAGRGSVPQRSNRT